MTNNDAADFQALLGATMELYGKSISSQALRLWWASLQDLSIDDVRIALSAHIRGARGHFAPMPSDVISGCQKDSGHLPADEAWAIALRSQDEAESVVWTTAIASALGAASPCLAAGDKYGARNAFLSAYHRLSVGEPAWTVSMGTCSASREIAIDKALRMKVICTERAAALLPYGSLKEATVTGLIEYKITEEERQKKLLLLQKLRDAIGVGNGTSD